MNYYISDLHIGHENILRFDNRPFADVNELVIHKNISKEVRERGAGIA